MENSTKFNKAEEVTIVTEVSPVYASFPDKSNFPVLKIDTRGKILYANHASFECLHEWLSDKEEYLPIYFMYINPDVLNSDADFSISLNVKTDVITFDVIGFKESGYIGLYGFESVKDERPEEHLFEIENSES
jgi:hypothetical protein